MVGYGWDFTVHTASPGQGDTMTTRWLLVSTSASQASRTRDLQTVASGRPSHAVLGGGLEPEVIPPKLQAGFCPHPRSPRASASVYSFLW